MQAIEIAIQYDKLLRLNITHNFFGDESPSIFSWQPSQETATFLNQIGVLLRYQNDSVLLLASSDDEEAMRKKLSENTEFTISFAVFSENAYFTHFTNLPLELKGHAFYFHNQHLKNKHNFLHPQTHAIQADMLPIMAGKATVDGQKAGSICTLAHSYLPTKLELIADENGQATAYLQDMPFGKYTIANNDKIASTFIYAPYLPNKTFVGWVDVVINQEMGKKWLTNSDRHERIVPETYQIKFETRSTYWRYYFVPKYAGNLNNTEIDTNGLALKFEQPIQVTLPNGLEAICFEAKTQMPLQKRAGNSMQLIRKKDSKGNNIRQVLCKVAQPSFEGLRAESRQLDAKVFSEMVIYV